MTTAALSDPGSGLAEPQGISAHSRSASPGPIEYSRQQELEQYRLGVEASPVGLLMIDTKGEITLANRQVELMFGYSREELLGGPVEKLIPQRFRGHHPAVVSRFFGTPSTRFMGAGRDLFGQRSDGSEFAIEIGLNPLRVGDHHRVLASIVDVTTRKGQEAELRSRVDELQGYQREMELLSVMSSLLQHALSNTEAHEIVAAFGQRLLPSVTVAVYTLPESQDALECHSQWGGATADRSFQQEACWAQRRSQVHCSGPDMAPRCTHGWNSPQRAQMCIPMSAHGRASGVITVGSEQPMEKGWGDLMRVGRAMADQLALALSNISLRESLRALSIRDPLTGLFNRRYLEEAIGRELPRAKRKNSEIAVWMLDVDHFKRYNDSHGHQAADAALQQLAKLMAAMLRAEDIVCRFGGEEFVVVLPDCSLADGARRADEMRQRVRSVISGISVSIGVAAWPQHGRAWEVVLRAADDALYKAKSGGRNLVVSAEAVQDVRPGQ
ncbi:MAG: diguanylate cyclase [Myxococcales bacterium]|nr:diguanylate cyclase [Myxococcales bacterium]